MIILLIVIIIALNFLIFRYCNVCVKVKVKIKFPPKTGHGGPEGK